MRVIPALGLLILATITAAAAETTSEKR